jgi:hypothetical protein
MSDLVKHLKKVSDEFKTLSTDIDKIIAKKKNELNNPGKEDISKSLSLKSLQPRTKLYKNKQEIVEAQKNPEFDFIKKQIEEILK